MNSISETWSNCWNDDPDYGSSPQNIGAENCNIPMDSSIGAIGPHTTFRRDPSMGKVTHYETYKPQTNPRNPNKWESQLRFDGPNADRHFNKVTGEYISTPHVHDPRAPGGVRIPKNWEIPN